MLAIFAVLLLLGSINIIHGQPVQQYLVDDGLILPSKAAESYGTVVEQQPSDEDILTTETFQTNHQEQFTLAPPTPRQRRDTEDEDLGGIFFQYTPPQEDTVMESKEVPLIEFPLLPAVEPIEVVSLEEGAIQELKIIDDPSEAAKQCDELWVRLSTHDLLFSIRVCPIGTRFF
ncbi:unnamed protein product [Haemonchus placei]|uniref:Conserved secreted protein n=1 Tax=Haemonchus placei TaxID=6290 RepID=A0A0N4X6V1_HAEPC|nr:unnamed protein product [Haemonchus placei]